jgi:hypothetical protein
MPQLLQGYADASAVREEEKNNWDGKEKRTFHLVPVLILLRYSGINCR